LAGLEVNDLMDDSQVLTLIKDIAADNGCRIVDIDLENQIINIEGPEDAKIQCAVDIGKILE
jgi:hypothetical protein